MNALMVAMATKPVSRATTIADFIYSTSIDALDAKEATAKASQVLQDASAEATNKREVLMAQIAEASRTQRWTEGEIDSAMAMLPKRVNDKARLKSLSTMGAEIKQAAHPAVCVIFATLSNLRDAAWAAEEAEIASAKSTNMPVDAPMKLAFKRKYHALVALMRHVSSGNGTFATVDDVLDFARSKDPRRDPEKIAKQIDALTANLREFHALFPVDSVEAMIEYMKTITADTLKAELDALADKQDEAAAAAEAEQAGLIGDVDSTLDNGKDSGEASENVVHYRSDSVQGGAAPNDPVDDALAQIDALTRAA